MTDETPTQPIDENHLIAERRAKLAALRGQGIAFPNDFLAPTTRRTCRMRMSTPSTGPVKHWKARAGVSPWPDGCWPSG